MRKEVDFQSLSTGTGPTGDMLQTTVYPDGKCSRLKLRGSNALFFHTRFSLSVLHIFLCTIIGLQAAAECV